MVVQFGLYVVCMFSYCLQLERFLCRECGKVKCSCDAPMAPDGPPPARSSPSDVTHTLKTHETYDTDSVELRNPILTIRRLSGPQINVGDAQKPPVHPQLSYRSSEQPFSRAGIGEGKLRRSFAVRSREGIENLLGLSSLRKSQEQSKNGRILRK